MSNCCHIAKDSDKACRKLHFKPVNQSQQQQHFILLTKKLSTQVAEYEATTFSIFYNNSLFLALVIIASFYLLNGTSAHVNYLLSIGLSSGLIALLSTGTQS